MEIYGNREIDTRGIARVDVDIVAHHVSPDEAEMIAEYLVSAIVTRCLMEFGQAPEIE